MPKLFSNIRNPWGYFKYVLEQHWQHIEPFQGQQKVGSWSGFWIRILFFFFFSRIEKLLFTLKSRCVFFKPLSSPFVRSWVLCQHLHSEPLPRSGNFQHDRSICSDLCCSRELPSLSRVAGPLPLPFHHPFCVLLCNNLGAAENSTPCTVPLKLGRTSRGYHTA